MTHRDVEPETTCPGWLRPDRYRLSRRTPTRKWVCSECRRVIWIGELQEKGVMRERASG